MNAVSLRIAGVLTLVALAHVGLAQTSGPVRQLKARFATDHFTVAFSEDSGRPDTGKHPYDAFAAAGVGFNPFPTFAPGGMIGAAVLGRDTSFGRAFRIIQTFDFGPDSRWSLVDMRPSYLFCAIPEGCPGVLEVTRSHNFSTRAEVRTGDGVTIGGMVIPGDYPRLVVFRVLGASLGEFGIGERLADPRLRLYEGSECIFENNDWESLREWERVLLQRVCALPDHAREAAIVTYLDPGAYTAVVSGADGGTGVALLEMYLLDEFLVE